MSHSSQVFIPECTYGCTLLIWGIYVRVHADSPEVTRLFSSIYSRFIVAAPHSAEVDFFVLRRDPDNGRPVCYIAGARYELSDTIRYISQAELILFRYLLEQTVDYVVLHAAVVKKDSRAIVLYGQSGFGKTTLALELLQRGYGFMSDEFCPIRLSDSMIEPFERLVGLKPTSPFYTSIDPERTIFLQSENKYFFDCSRVYNKDAASACRPGVFIELAGTMDTEVCPPGGLALDICMCRNSTSAVPDAIRQLPAVRLSGPLYNDNYAVYRVTAQDGAAFLAGFNKIWQECSSEIFSVYPYKGEVESFDNLPDIQPVSPFTALTSIVSNIVNRSPNGRLLAACGGKTSQLLVHLGNLLDGVSFYSIRPGQLAKMADLIDNLP